tara:strand:- start:1601 stop:1744 length:144 start_codon:yes stop_codon:yes gene_type:complete
MKKQKTKKIKSRNWVAVSAHFRKGGAMQDRKKESKRKACRGKVNESW